MSLILDVRTPAEVAEGHLEGALFVDFMADDFREKGCGTRQVSRLHRALPLRKPFRSSGSHYGGTRIYR